MIVSNEILINQNIYYTFGKMNGIHVFFFYFQLKGEKKSRNILTECNVKQNFTFFLSKIL